GTLAVLLLSFAHRLTGAIRIEPQSLLRGALASAAAAVVGWLTVTFVGGAAGVVAGGVGAAAIFVVLAPTLRILAADDANWLDETIGRSLGGRVGSFCRLCARPAPAGP